MLFGRAQRQWHSLTYATREKNLLKRALLYTPHALTNEGVEHVHERELPSVAIGAFLLLSGVLAFSDRQTFRGDFSVRWQLYE